MTERGEHPLVVVTGATGFIAQHCVRQLLQQGYRVCATSRNLAREHALRSLLASDADQSARLDFLAADLTKDAAWQEILAGALYVLHTASPVPFGPPKEEAEVLVPAIEGTLRVLQAAARAGVGRVVLTSSISAVLSGVEQVAGATFTETDWSDMEGDIGLYARSKTLAERAAWAFQAELPAAQRFELCALNPVYVIGPSVDGHKNASNEIVRKLVARELPGLPRLRFPLVDVRDVATAHLLAMTNAQAAGERFILSAHDVWYREIAAILRTGGHRVPALPIPDWVVRVMGWFDPHARSVASGLGWEFHASSEKARRVLGWETRPLDETLLETASSLLSFRGR